jgi:hypothetical protein
MLPYMLVRNKGGLIPWYLKGSVSKANCLAAYQAIGAADLATSFINLVNPGTYNLTGGVDPDFDIEKGWTFNGTTQYKSTGIDPATNATNTWTAILRFSNLSGDTGLAFGGADGSAGYFSIAPRRSSGMRKYYNGAQCYTGPHYTTSGVCAVAGTNGYYNGNFDGAGCLSPFECPTIWIGGTNLGGGSLFLPYAGNIEAIAFYNTVLTAAQILAISNAMAALPLPFDISNPAFPGPLIPDVGLGEFTIVDIGDMHIGTWTTQAQPEIMMKYLKDNATRLNIQAVLNTGDFEDNVDHSDDRAVFMASMANLVDIPHLVAAGNHEYDYSGGPRNSTVFNSVLGPTYYTGKSWWSGGFYEAGRSENAYLLLTIGAVDYILINMEFFPRQGVIDWLNTLLTTYSSRKAIICTHAYEYGDGTPYSVGDGFGPDGEQEGITDSDYHWGDEMWTELLKVHDNIILVISGHVTPPARHVANSDGGQPINQTLFDLQGWTPGVDATFMRFMLFNPTDETIKVMTYSPVTKTTSAISTYFMMTY